MAYVVESFEHQLDAKNRIRIPAKLHIDLGKEFYLMYGSDGCISVYSKESLDARLARLTEIRPGGGDQLLAMRAVLGSIASVTEDDQGRILLPSKLRQRAGITKSVVSIGMLDHIEIWSKERYEETVGQMSVDEALKLLDF